MKWIVTEAKVMVSLLPAFCPGSNPLCKTVQRPEAGMTSISLSLFLHPLPPCPLSLSPSLFLAFILKKAGLGFLTWSGKRAQVPFKTLLASNVTFDVTLVRMSHMVLCVLPPNLLPPKGI